jgi:hypothetical protein
MFRDTQQIAAALRVLLQPVHLSRLWLDDRPTPEASELRTAADSASERVMLCAAWDLWNGSGGLSLDRMLNVLDANNTLRLCTLIMAAATGAAAVDSWIDRWKRSDEFARVLGKTHPELAEYTEEMEQNLLEMSQKTERETRALLVDSLAELGHASDRETKLRREFEELQEFVPRISGAYSIIQTRLGAFEVWQRVPTREGITATKYVAQCSSLASAERRIEELQHGEREQHDEHEVDR